MSFSPSMRAMASVPAPAGKPTSRRIGAPLCWACARPAVAVTAASASAARRLRDRTLRLEKNMIDSKSLATVNNEKVPAALEAPRNGPILDAGIKPCDKTNSPPNFRKR